MLTSWRLKRGDRTQKESDRVRGTHPERSGYRTEVTDEGHHRSTRKSNIALALLKHMPKIDLDPLYGLTLTLMDGESPRKDERNLVAW